MRATEAIHVRRPRWASRPTVVLGFLLALLGSSVGAEERTSLTFEKDVVPLLRAKCWQCHGAEKQKSGLDLRTKATLVKGGESGPGVTPGSAESSTLWEKVASDKMPPGKEKLTDSEKTLLRAWIDGGAKGLESPETPQAPDVSDRQVTDADREFWSFRPPVRHPVPTVKGANLVRNPIDSFLLAKLEAKGLSFTQEADRRTLLRRAYFDLTGLPPCPQEVETFVADDSPDAYERLIDRLLASPHYGERWGRHWLDVAGYADSEGILDADYVRAAAWRYRDYVVRAFNTDKPYDRFLKEQLAGDELADFWTAYHTQKELPPEVVEAVVATGFLRCAGDTSRPDFATIKNAPGYYYQTLDDTLRIVSSAVLGLTVQCAKCHSHKYDPIPQTDYYRLQAVFMSAYRPHQWVPQVNRRLWEATEAQEQEAKAFNTKIDAAVAQLRTQVGELQRQFGDRLFQERLAKLPEPIREDVRTASATEAAKRTEIQKYLAEKFQKELRPEVAQLQKVLAETYADYKPKAQELESAIKQEESKRRSFPEIRALFDLPGEAKTPLLRRGDYLNPGPEVPPGVLGVLRTGKPFMWSPGSAASPEIAKASSAEPPEAPDQKGGMLLTPPPLKQSSGRRLAFAEWLAQPDHPLTARVFVNRVWLQHFGEGIVATADNFGRSGSTPSHPELLDWLATEFQASGWSAKAMHRLIMTSSAYRQSSRFDPVAHARAGEVDPENRLLWRQRMRRVEAEVLRDATLFASGSLNPEMYGTPVPMHRQGDGEVTTAPDAAGNRRSVYLQARRSQPLTLLQVFDQPVMETNCPRRGTSTVSSQALSLLNSDFMIRQADALAARALRECPNDATGMAFLLALGRRPTEAEQSKFAAFLDAQTGAYKATATPDEEARRRALGDFCQMVLSSNEFAYID